MTKSSIWFDILSHSEINWKVSSIFCGLLRKSQLYERDLELSEKLTKIRARKFINLDFHCLSEFDISYFAIKICVWENQSISDQIYPTLILHFFFRITYNSVSTYFGENSTIEIMLRSRLALAKITKSLAADFSFRKETRIAWGKKRRRLPKEPEQRRFRPLKN